MENQDLDISLAQASHRIRQAIARGPLGREKGFVEISGDRKEATPVPAETPRAAFTSVRNALARIKALMGEAPVQPTLEHVEAPQEPGASSASASVVAAPSVPQGPSLRDLFLRMGGQEFWRVVQDTLSFDYARAGGRMDFDFVAANARTTPSDAPVSPASSYQDQIALRGIIRQNVASYGFEKTEDRLRTILYAEEKNARAVQQGHTAAAERSSPALDESPVKTHLLVKTHLAATHATDWTPDREPPENVALVDRHLTEAREVAPVKDRAQEVREKIQHIHDLEGRLVHMAVEDPALISDAVLENENRWSPRAHSLAASRGLEPTPAMTKLADLYNRLIGFLKPSKINTVEPVDPPTAAVSTPAGTALDGRITGNKGVYHHRPLEIS